MFFGFCVCFTYPIVNVLNGGVNNKHSPLEICLICGQVRKGEKKMTKIQKQLTRLQIEVSNIFRRKKLQLRRNRKMNNHHLFRIKRENFLEIWVGRDTLMLFNIPDIERKKEKMKEKLPRKVLQAG